MPSFRFFPPNKQQIFQWLLLRSYRFAGCEIVELNLRSRIIFIWW